MSRLVLFFHTLVLTGLVIACLLSPVFALNYWIIFDTYVLRVFGGIGVLTLATWYVYGGECPFTVWENSFRKSEGKQIYTEPCMDRYALRWFGLTLPRRFSDIFPIAILLIPLVTRAFI